MNNSFNIIKYSFCAIAFLLIIAYLLCDMSMTLNNYLKFRHYKTVSNTIKNIHFSDGNDAYIELEGDYTEYVTIEVPSQYRIQENLRKHYTTICVEAEVLHRVIT